MFLAIQSKISSFVSTTAAKFGVTDADTQSGLFMGLILVIGIVVGIGICMLKDN